MENQPTQPSHLQDMPQPLPNATAVLVLGIISIVGCFCYGLVGIICGIIALILAGKAKTLYNAAPTAYTEASYKNVHAGRICAIIGTILSVLYLILIIILVFTIGFTALSDPNFIKALQSR